MRINDWSSDGCSSDREIKMDEINPTNPQPVNTTPPPARPKNWLVESILVTLFCCLPFGIVGIVYAASVHGKYDAGQYNEALESSDRKTVVSGTSVSLRGDHSGRSLLKNKKYNT